jgi:Zn-dependent protease with chaperone function
MELMAIFREFAQAAAPAAVAALWQGVVLAAGLAVCLLFAPRLSATDRFRLWAVGFAATAFLPFLPWLSSLWTGSWSGPSVEVGAVAVARPWLDFDPRWTLVIAGFWIAASAWRLTDLAAHGLRLRRLWKRAMPLRFDGSRIEVCTTRDLDRPSVIGFFRPRILIPAWLLERLTERELEQVVLHEAEHLRRRDDWINLAQKLALAVFPLNPALWWIERRMCREREMACDEAVVRATEKPRDYAACLASLAERGLERRLQRRGEALSLGAWHRRPELVERVHRILKRGPGLSRAAARGLLAVVGCGLALGSVEFARCPQLVAFVARPVATGQDVPDTAMLSGYKVVDAMARVPSSEGLATLRSASQAARVMGSSALATEKNRRDGAKKILTARGNRVQAQPAEMQTAMAAQAGQVSVQQFVVFTAFEQVVTADDIAQPTSEGQTQNKPAVAPQFMVTQLILRVYPVEANRSANGSGAEKASSGSTSSGSNSRSSSSSAPAHAQQLPPLRDGFLVLQL